MPGKDQKSNGLSVTQDNLVECAEQVIHGELPPEEFFQAVERRAEDMADLEAKRPRAQGLLPRWQWRKVSHSKA
jgi:hypothetical protein